MTVGLVGIIANPASGKDIRRLVAHGSAFDNNEKINIVRRVLLGLDAVGVARVAYLPDPYGIVERAAATVSLRLSPEPLPMAVLGVAGDSTEAAARLADLGAGAIVTLGGDGTNRAVAKSCRDVPLVPISTGTNNVFPTMVEGTLAGLAAGLVAIGVAGNRSGGERVVRRHPILEVAVDGHPTDVALIDVVTSTQAWVGARAFWSPAHLREIVLSRLEPACIGAASLGGLLFPDSCGGCAGAHIRVGDGSAAHRRLLAPLAPGILTPIPIAEAAVVQHGDTVVLDGAPCTVALDGERELHLSSGAALSVRLEPRGPRVVDVAAAIAAGSRAGAFGAA